MQYRDFGGIGFRPSVLGFGAMRLPQLADGTAATDAAFARIDVETADSMLRRAIEAGVNYVDTAYPYHDGASERSLARPSSPGPNSSAATTRSAWPSQRSLAPSW